MEIVIIILIVVLIFFIIYNMLTIKRNKVVRSKANVEVYLTQRFDLIPNLVECVKQYTNFEKNLLEELIEMRMQYMKEKNLKIGNILDKKLENIIIQVENYPDLKASEQYTLLEKNLIKMENQIQAARRIYNIAVLKYNNLVKIFPSNIVAKIFKFKTETFFEFEENIKNNGEIYEKNNKNNF